MSDGTTSTRRALSTSATAARWPIQPAGPAMTSTPLRTDTPMPHTWTSPITGTATRLSTRPALVTRENAHAFTGSSATSTATEAASDAMNHRTTR